MAVTLLSISLVIELGLMLCTSCNLMKDRRAFNFSLDELPYASSTHLPTEILDGIQSMCNCDLEEVSNNTDVGCSIVSIFSLVRLCLYKPPGLK